MAEDGLSVDVVNRVCGGSRMHASSDGISDGEFTPKSCRSGHGRSDGARRTRFFAGIMDQMDRASSAVKSCSQSCRASCRTPSRKRASSKPKDQEEVAELQYHVHSTPVPKLKNLDELRQMHSKLMEDAPPPMLQPSVSTLGLNTGRERKTSFYRDSESTDFEDSAAAKPLPWLFRWLFERMPRRRSFSSMPLVLRVRAPQNFDRFVIHPYSRWKLSFDILIIACVAYTSFTMPVKITYGIDFLQGLETTIDVLFALDVVLTFFHGYVEMGYPVLSLRACAIRYVRSWFLVDLIASVPFDAFHSGLRSLQLIKTLRLFRVQRLLRK
jgi:hypothetical protein